MSASPRGPNADALKSALQARILDLCGELLPGGRSDGTHWLVGSVLGEPGQSMRVMLTRGHEGRWKDFSSGEAGNALSLCRACLFPQDRDWRRTLGWASWWLGYTDMTPEEVERVQAEAERRRRENEQAAAERADRYRAAARRVFFGAHQRIDGTPAAAYLAGRGIDPAFWGGGWPRLLRFAPELMHGKSGLVAPALVAGITDTGGQVIAVHRTWLEEDGAGGWRKVADLGREAKMSLGGYKQDGGYVRLRRGGTGRPWNKPDGGEWVHVTEGLEDALVLAMALPEARVACAVSLGSLANARFPAGIAGVVICADRDAPDSAAAKALGRAVEAQRRRGLSVRVMQPPPPHKDLNDWLRSTPGA